MVESFLRRRPPDRALTWVLAQTRPGSRVSSIRRLRGGTSSATHAINLRDPRNLLRRLVLRRYVRADWLAREPDLAAREATALQRVAPLDLPTPRLLAVDPDGARVDVPAVMTERLPGRLDLAPDRPAAWFQRLAALLPPLHALDADPAFRRRHPYNTYVDLQALQVPPWSAAPAAWARVIACAQGPEPPGPRTVIHRDFHPGNVLWRRGRVSGLTDWVNASYGPPGIDVGHCRLNLAVLFGRPAADQFLRAYQRLPQATAYHPHWDCRTLVEVLPHPPGAEQWHDAGRLDLSRQSQMQRLDAYAVSLAARLGPPRD